MKQVVVLSHNEFFLHEISKDWPSVQLKTLCITENFVAKSSALEICDLSDLVKNDYFKQIEALEKWRQNPNLILKDTILGSLRTVLESHIKFKFYRQVRSMGGAQKTFGALIIFLDTSSVIFTNNSNRAAIITKLKLINSISWRPHHGGDIPDYSLLGVNPATITAPELDNFIQDTLRLIDQEL